MTASQQACNHDYNKGTGHEAAEEQCKGTMHAALAIPVVHSCALKAQTRKSPEAQAKQTVIAKQLAAGKQVCTNYTDGVEDYIQESTCIA